MKKILLSILVLMLFTGCSKEQKSSSEVVCNITEDNSNYSIVTSQTTQFNSEDDAINVETFTETTIIDDSDEILNTVKSNYDKEIEIFKDIEGVIIDYDIKDNVLLLTTKMNLAIMSEEEIRKVSSSYSKEQLKKTNYLKSMADLGFTCK